MSGRRGIVVDVTVPTDPTESPNRQADYVSCHVRVYWPYTATSEQIDAAIVSAMQQAHEKAQQKWTRLRTSN